MATTSDRTVSESQMTTLTVVKAPFDLAMSDLKTNEWNWYTLDTPFTVL